MSHAKGQITTRELIDLQSHLMLETNLIGQFNHFAREFKDPQLKRMSQDMARSRMDCYQLLSQHMNIGTMQ